MGDLNDKVGNSGVEYVVGRHGAGVRNDNGGRCEFLQHPSFGYWLKNIPAPFA